MIILPNLSQTSGADIAVPPMPVAYQMTSHSVRRI